MTPDNVHIIIYMGIRMLWVIFERPPTTTITSILYFYIYMYRKSTPTRRRRWMATVENISGKWIYLRLVERAHEVNSSRQYFTGGRRDAIKFSFILPSFRRKCLLFFFSFLSPLSSPYTAQWLVVRVKVSSRITMYMYVRVYTRRRRLSDTD